MFASSSLTDRPDVFVCQWIVMIMLYLLDKYIIHCTGNACVHKYNIYTMQMVHIPCCMHAVYMVIFASSHVC